MERFKYIVYIAICSLGWHWLIFFQSTAYAEESLSDTFDCTDVSVDYLEDSSLTQEERLRLMDKAFFQSLNKFELCQEAKKMAKASGGSNGGGGSGGGSGGSSGSGGNGGNTGGDSGDEALETGGMASGESAASSTMSGTEAPQNYPPAEGLEGSGDASAQQSSQDVAEAGSKSGGNMQSSNGKLPDDIPPAKNDDALAAQIRYAAENESDPEKSKQLWNEYRKYKGLPTK